MKVGQPYPIRFTSEDVEAIDYLKKRLGIETVQIVRMGLRRLVQLEQTAEKKEAAK